MGASATTRPELLGGVRARDGLVAARVRTAPEVGARANPVPLPPSSAAASAQGGGRRGGAERRATAAQGATAVCRTVTNPAPSCLAREVVRTARVAPGITYDRGGARGRGRSWGRAGAARSSPCCGGDCDAGPG